MKRAAWADHRQLLHKRAFHKALVRERLHLAIYLRHPDLPQVIADYQRERERHAALGLAW